MRFKVQVVAVSDEGESEPAQPLLEFERRELRPETLGLTLAEGKDLLKDLQEFVVEHQVTGWLARQKACPLCQQLRTAKGVDRITVRTVFGKVSLPSPRWRHCRCRPQAQKSFRPLAAALPERTSPELLYLETKLAALVSYGATASLLHEKLNAITVRNHLLGISERCEARLGEERGSFLEGCPRDWAELPIPDGPLTVGIDGGYVRGAGALGSFEVIAGKSVLEFERDAEKSVRSSQCFAYVQTYDTKPRRRLWELLKSQGLQLNQQVVFLSDGGEDVRHVPEMLCPEGEHWLDWFHITMRLTVLLQQTKTVQTDHPALGLGVADLLGRAKHCLWHGNVGKALDRLESAQSDLECVEEPTPAIAKLLKGIGELRTYVDNNHAFIPNFGERYRQGETITTAFVESTVNQVVSKRMVKKQQMRWTPRGAHLLLQARTQLLNGTLEDTFRSWYPTFRKAA
jgi:hypothetical protein